MSFVSFNTEVYLQNLSKIYGLIPKKTKLCIVLKSDAYGIGIENIVKLNIWKFIDYIAITKNKEAEIIRKYNSDIKIIRVRPATIDEILEGGKYHIEEVIDTIDKFTQIKENKDLIKLNYHLSINYGMGNLGFEVNQKIISEINNINLSGILTHFPNIYNQSDSKFKNIIQLVDKIKSIYHKNELIFHCCNTENYIEHGNLLSYDMLRVGKLQYGIIKNNINLQSVVEWHCKPVSIRKHFKGDTISYKSLYISNKKENIIVLPIGYNEGYPCFENNKSEVIINNKKYPVVGKITMNMICVNVGSDIINLNDKVTLFGESKDKKILLNNIFTNSYYHGGLFLLNLCRHNSVKII